MKLNNTDIRTVKVYNPSIVSSVGLTANNAQTEWKYLLSGNKSIPSSVDLQQGVYLRNIGDATAAVVSIQGISAGISNPIGAGYTFNGYVIPSRGEVFLPVDDLAKVIVKATSATTVGITFSYIAT
jgi:hypothetical protein